MNNYIPRMKDAILDYLSAAQRVQKTLAAGRAIYNADGIAAEEKRLGAELAKARADAEARIDAVYQEASAEASAWGRLDGSRLTDDVKLLEGQGVTPAQFKELVERYQDNFTMLDQLKKYGERMNETEVKAAREAGKRDEMFVGSYDVHNIPDASVKMGEAAYMRRMAGHFLDVADGRGVDEFTWNFARSTADSLFKTWGTAPVAPIPEPGASQSFVDAWGWGKQADA